MSFHFKYISLSFIRRLFLFFLVYLLQGQAFVIIIIVIAIVNYFVIIY